MLRGAIMRWTSTWYSETGISFGWKGPIGLNTDFTFLTFTKFFLQSSRGSERFSHLTEIFCIGTKVCTMQLLALCQKSWCECMIQLWRITILILEKNLIHQVFFLFVCECNLAQVAPCHFYLESVWKNDFDIVHVLLRAVHRQHVQSAMQRYQARWLLCLTSRCLGSNFRAGMYLLCSLISEVLICCLLIILKCNAKQKLV